MHKTNQEIKISSTGSSSLVRVYSPTSYIPLNTISLFLCFLYFLFLLIGSPPTSYWFKLTSVAACSALHFCAILHFCSKLPDFRVQPSALLLVPPVKKTSIYGWESCHQSTCSSSTVRSHFYYKHCSIPLHAILINIGGTKATKGMKCLEKYQFI